MVLDRNSVDTERYRLGTYGILGIHAYLSERPDLDVEPELDDPL